MLNVLAALVVVNQEPDYWSESVGLNLGSGAGSEKGQTPVALQAFAKQGPWYSWQMSISSAVTSLHTRIEVCY